MASRCCGYLPCASTGRRPHWKWPADSGAGPAYFTSVLTGSAMRTWRAWSMPASREQRRNSCAGRRPPPKEYPCSWKIFWRRPGCPRRSPRRAALAFLDAAHPRVEGGLRELAVELANRAGDRRRAGTLLSESGGQALAWGALATAIGTLRRAADLLEGTPEREQAELLLVEALALAGRVEEAAAARRHLITRLGTEAAELRTEVHFRLSQAAVAASRWHMARHHLGAARRLAGTGPAAGARARMGVIDAEVAFAADDLDEARLLAEHVLAAEGSAPDVRCHALELIGRSHRLRDLSPARAPFESALVTAETAGLPLWRLRALHELGTIDLLDHAGVERLSEARRAAEQMGALSTVAVVGLPLAAGLPCPSG